jgi:HK97 family phage major capsid protein
LTDSLSKVRTQNYCLNPQTHAEYKKISKKIQKILLYPLSASILVCYKVIVKQKKEGEMMQKAIANFANEAGSGFTLHQKSVDSGFYIFEGYGAVFDIIDNHGDMIASTAFEDSITKHRQRGGIKFLWQHDSFHPLGNIEDIKSDSYGLKVRVAINSATEKGGECIALIKQGVIDSLSIGFQIAADHYDHSNGCRVIDSAKLLEVSAVTFPANEEAKISSKSTNKHYKQGGSMSEDLNSKLNSLYKEIEETKQESHQKSQMIEEQKHKNQELENKLNNLEVVMDRPSLAENGTASLQSKDLNFENFIRKGEIEQNYTTKSMNHMESEDGGYLIEPEIYNKIIEQMAEISPIRKLASIDKISSNALELIMEHDKFKCGWVNDISEMQEETGSPKLSRKKIYVHELFAQPKASQRLIDDALVDVEAWLVRQLKTSFAAAEAESFINGDGNNKPRGLLSYSDEEISRLDAVNYNRENKPAISYELLNQMLSSLKDQHQTEASFLMHRETLNQVRNLKDDAGHLIWQPSLSEKSPGTIFGLPVYTCDQMPRPKEGADAIILANFAEAYKIVDRRDINIMRDPYTEKPFVKFYSTKRVGGDVVNREAMVIARLF